MRNYVLKAAVVAAQIDSINGNTVYFTDGSTLDVDNEFITNQVPGSGDYVIDGVKVMERGKFEAMYCEDLPAEPVDEGEVIDGLRQDLSVAGNLLDESAQEIERLKTQLAEVADNAPLDVTQAGGSEGSDPSPPEGGDIPEGTVAGDEPAVS